MTMHVQLQKCLVHKCYQRNSKASIYYIALMMMYGDLEMLLRRNCARWNGEMDKLIIYHVDDAWRTTVCGLTPVCLIRRQN